MTISRTTASRRSTPIAAPHIGSRAPRTPRCSLGNLDRIKALLAQDRNLEAEFAAQEEYAVRNAQKGPHHPETLSAQTYVVEALLAQDELAAACSLSREVWAAYKDVLGAEHPDTLHCVSLLVEALERLGHGHHAEAVMLRQHVFGKHGVLAHDSDKSTCTDKSTSCSEDQALDQLDDDDFVEMELSAGLEDACEVVCWDDAELRAFHAQHQKAMEAFFSEHGDAVVFGSALSERRRKRTSALSSELDLSDLSFRFM